MTEQEAAPAASPAKKPAAAKPAPAKASPAKPPPKPTFYQGMSAEEYDAAHAAIAYQKAEAAYHKKHAHLWSPPTMTKATQARLV